MLCRQAHPGCAGSPMLCKQGHPGCAGRVAQVVQAGSPMLCRQGHPGCAGGLNAALPTALGGRLSDDCPIPGGCNKVRCIEGMPVEDLAVCEQSQRESTVVCLGHGTCTVLPQNTQQCYDVVLSRYSAGTQQSRHSDWAGHDALQCCAS